MVQADVARPSLPISGYKQSFWLQEPQGIENFQPTWQIPNPLDISYQFLRFIKSFFKTLKLFLTLRHNSTFTPRAGQCGQVGSIGDPRQEIHSNLCLGAQWAGKSLLRGGPGFLHELKPNGDCCLQAIADENVRARKPSLKTMRQQCCSLLTISACQSSCQPKWEDETRCWKDGARWVLEELKGSGRVVGWSATTSKE